MKHNWNLLKKYSVWLFLLLMVDAFSAILLWASDIDAFRAVLAVILLATVLMFSFVFVIILFHERKKEEAFRQFLTTTDDSSEEALLKLCSASEQELILLLEKVLREKEMKTKQLLTRVTDYEEYVEAWAHETKTPLSLLTLLLDNRRDDIPQSLTIKLDLVRTRMQESINQMLFYARLKGVKKDYLLENIQLKDCIDAILEEYRPLLEENKFKVTRQIPDFFVYSDKRALTFLLSQIISNAVKYNKKGQTSAIEITCSTDNNRYCLTILDHGIGVHSCDLPYIFEKGFTGNCEEGRSHATGMGLYLARTIARDLNLSLEASSEWGNGFTMTIVFPVINE